MLERPSGSVILFVAASLLAVACSAAGPTGSVAPSPVVVPTASPPPSMALGTPAAEAPVPVCNDLKPSWVEAANSVQNGPDPAGRIVFGQVSRADEYSEVVDPLFAIDPDGSDLVQILSCEVERPRISHDGTRLAFSIFMSDRTWQVATSAMDGSDLSILTSTSGWASMPDWAPDDSWLVYAYSPNPCNVPTCVEDGIFRQTLWRMNADGSDQRLLGDPDAFDSEARLSPDGRQVVFDRWDASKQLQAFMIRDLATGDERRVTTTNTTGLEHPDWTRDGGSIVYNTNDDDNHVYWVQTVPADDPAAAPTTLYGDAEHRSAGRPPFNGSKAAYSPDGTRVVFRCGTGLCLMDADGSNAKVFIEPAGVDLNHSAWGATP